MSRYVVTVKFDRNPAHNPNRKVTGPCPLSEQACTDRTGAHHSTVVDTVATVAEVCDWFTQRGIHVTRIETVAPEVIVTDAMVNAARDAIAARCTHPRMGDWWPCNFGADKVRICPDCDHIEKRPYRPEGTPS